MLELNGKTDHFSNYFWTIFERISLIRYLSHLRGELGVQKYEDLSNFNSDLEAVAVVPEHPPDDWDYDVGHLYRYVVTPKSMVHFLSQTYCFAYLLDFSPSSSTPDLLASNTLVNMVVPALRTSLTNLVRPFYVPGSQLLLRPDIYVTVIAWTPFIAEGAQAVLCQGKNPQCRKTWNSLSPKFREINYVVASLVKTVLSRNFCQNV